MQDQWKRELTEQVEKELDQYTPFRIPLDNANDNELVAVAGKTIYVQDSSGETALATIKLNRDRAGDLALAKGVLIESVFRSIYLTNTAQAGAWLDVVFGRDFRMSAEGQKEGLIKDIYRFVANQAQYVATGPDKTCTEVMIMAHPDNEDIVWVKPYEIATVSNAWPLEPKEVTGWTLENLNQLNVRIIANTEKIIVAYTY